MLHAPTHPLFGSEAREHTAHVDPTTAKSARNVFRFGDSERRDLDSDTQRLREAGEANRFLPVLFCSPTMELGVDIAALNAVHMRNVPPTPANYAQRGGRAGRSGQAALVVTYASSQSPHDQYFFQQPKRWSTARSVPDLELANRDSDRQPPAAAWLSWVQKPLDLDRELPSSTTPTGPSSRTSGAPCGKACGGPGGERIRRVLYLVATN